MSEEATLFYLTYPCFVMVPPHVINEHGNLKLDENLQFAIIPGDSEHEPAIAIFTDSHLAEQFHESLESRVALGPQELAQFLRYVRQGYRWLAIDPNPKTHGLIRMALESVLDAIYRQGHPS